LLKEKLKKGDKISLIIVDNVFIKDIVYSLLSKFSRSIPVKVSQKYSQASLIVLGFAKFLRLFHWMVVNWLWPRLTRVYRKHPGKKIVFVDNFVLPSSFNKQGGFVERYYTGYDAYLDADQCQNIYYAPTLFGFKSLRQYIQMSNRSMKSCHNFLFQESWLKLSDYLFAARLTVTLPLKIRKIPLLLECDFSQLLLFEARKDMFSPSLAMAVCKFRFIKNLRAAGVEVYQVVDWHENQAVDKALNLGFHQYYPGVVVRGYQGYVSPAYETHKIPQPFEFRQSVLPNQLFIISKIQKRIVLDECPDLNVKMASAFRFSYLYDIDRSKVSKTANLSILIALPMDIDESIGILNSCIHLKSALDKEVNILVKHHPGYGSKEFARQVPEFLNDDFLPVDSSMSDLLSSVSMLISSASSTCAEAASLGIPVAIYGNRYGVTMDPINNKTNRYLNKVYYSNSQLLKFVKLYLGRESVDLFVKETFFIDDGESAKELFVSKLNGVY